MAANPGSEAGMLIGTYFIQVMRGLSSNRSLLSCGIPGHVDLFPNDDGSGRQKWELATDGDFFTLKASGGTDPGKEYLQCVDDSIRVWLGPYSESHARWKLRTVATVPEIPAYYALVSVSELWSNHLLSCSADGTRVELAWRDDGSGRQRWQFQGPDVPKDHVSRAPRRRARRPVESDQESPGKGVRRIG